MHTEQTQTFHIFITRSHICHGPDCASDGKDTTTTIKWNFRRPCLTLQDLWQLLFASKLVSYSIGRLQSQCKTSGFPTTLKSFTIVNELCVCRGILPQQPYGSLLLDIKGQHLDICLLPSTSIQNQKTFRHHQNLIKLHDQDSHHGLFLTNIIYILRKKSNLTVVELRPRH